MTESTPAPDLDPQRDDDSNPEVEAQPFEPAGGRTYDMPGADEAAGEPSGAGVAAGSTTLGAICHLLGLADMALPPLLLGFVGPLILWLTMKDQDPEVDFAGKESINFQLNLLVWSIAGVILIPCIITIPFILLAGLILPIAEIALVILATIKTAAGERYRYPFIFRVLV